MLTLENITKSFGDKKILTDFSYRFDDVGIYAVTGKSGTGKTTLLRMIAGLDKDFSGNISGNGSGVSVCFQEHRLFPNLSALRNITEFSFKNDIPLSVRKEKAQNMLYKLSFSAEDMQLKPGKLSGGMRQRVAIARALLSNAPILILDEATKELDAQLKQTVLSLIADEAKKRLVIIVTHNDSEIDLLNAVRIQIPD